MVRSSTLLRSDQRAAEALARARAPHLEGLGAQVRAALDAIEAATRREAARARRARRRLREALREDARFLLAEAPYQAFRAELMATGYRRDPAPPPVPERLRAPDFVVAFDGYRRSIEEDYNDEEHYLSRVITTRVTVGTHRHDVSVPVAERFALSPDFVDRALSLDRVSHHLEDLVYEALGRPARTPFSASWKEGDYGLVHNLFREVAALLLFALPLLRPARVRARLP